MTTLRLRKVKELANYHRVCGKYQNRNPTCVVPECAVLTSTQSYKQNDTYKPKERRRLVCPSEKLVFQSWAFFPKCQALTHFSVCFPVPLLSVAFNKNQSSTKLTSDIYTALMTDCNSYGLVGSYAPRHVVRK